MSKALQNRTLLITGANRGIGKAFAEVFLDRGARKVYAAVRDPATTLALTSRFGDRVVPLRLDLHDEASILQAAVDAPDVDLLINNAGAFNKVSALDARVIPALQELMETNVYGLLRVAQAFAPVLKSNGGGTFVQLNSVVSLRASAQGTAYSASKAAAYSVTQALGVLLGEQGTRVVSVFPGPIDTDMGVAAGVQHMAVPPEVVATSLDGALSRGDFHLFPDPFAERMGEAYRGFAAYVEEMLPG